MVYKHKIVNRKDYFLVRKQALNSELNYFNRTQNILNDFKNIAIRPYKGEKYNQDLFCWIVIG